MPQIFPMNWILISSFLIFSTFTMTIFTFFFKLNFLKMKSNFFYLKKSSNMFKW
nr:ATP synthase subunit 8 [Amblyomma sp.]